MDGTSKTFLRGVSALIMFTCTLSGSTLAQQRTVTPIAKVAGSRVGIDWKRGGSGGKGVMEAFSNIKTICVIPVTEIQFVDTLVNLPSLESARALYGREKRLRQFRGATDELLKKYGFQPIDCLGGETGEDARIVLADMAKGGFDWRLISGPSLTFDVYGEKESVPFAGPYPAENGAFLSSNLDDIIHSAARAIEKVRKELPGKINQLR